MKVGILTIGDELVIGQVVNTNSSWIAEQCTLEGHAVLRQVSVSDSIVEINNAIDWVSDGCDVIITSGGIGPTHDDVTTAALATYFHDELIVDPNWLKHLEGLMKSRSRPLTPTNAAQARVPSSATVLHNTIGTAPGLMLSKPALLLYALPGVPAEMKALMLGEVLPRMREGHLEVEKSYYRTIHTAGIVESNLADRIGNVPELLHDVVLAILPSYHGVRLRIGVMDISKPTALKRLDEAELALRQVAGEHYVSVEPATIVSEVARLLTQNHQTVTTAESCTGGKLSSVFTDLPGSSSWFLGGAVTYSDSSKSSILQVEERTIRQYGAVSEQTAIEMAEGAKRILGSDYSVAITGVAGPDGGSDEKPVGTVWIAVASPIATICRIHHLGTERSINRERAVGASLWMLLQSIREFEKRMACDSKEA